MTTNRHKAGSEGAISARQQIVAKTTSEVRTFVDEITNGTANYRTVHSLTEQIEHQYHDRFAIELLQNAHDALLADRTARNRRVTFRIDASVGEHGALLVANDGKPFQRENFLALARLGQSSKDFRESIGNKGLGFRSVLQICTSPEVYSCGPNGGELFNGFSFRFSPKILDGFGSLLQRILDGDDQTSWDLDGERFDLGELRLTDFRRACSEQGMKPKEEFRLLSPYLLPVPARATDATVHALGRAGYATVVRLPFNGPEGRQKAVDCLAGVDSDALLFLEGLDALSIDDGSGAPRELRRTARSQLGARTQVTITEHKTVSSPRRFWVWQGTICGPNDGAGADALRQAASDLPGRWPQMAEATVSIAVQVGSVALLGRHFIFLPTCLESGTGAHFNAPFYGNMSRTEVNFDEPLNAVLLDQLARLVTKVILRELIGAGVDEACAIVDLLVAPTGVVDHEWINRLRPELGGAPLFRTERGWLTMEEARAVPDLPEAQILSPSALRRHAAFAAIDTGLDSRALQVAEVLRAFGGCPEPTQDERASTVEKIASASHLKLDWERFWIEVERLVPDSNALHGRSALLCEDGTLRGSNASVRVFFPPALGGDDESPQRPGVQVPESLADRIAFLSRTIPLRRRNAAGRWEQSPTRKYLDSLVDEYGVETIIKSVLVPALPLGVVPLDSRKGRLCRDVLDFAVRLVVSAREDSSLVPLLERIRLPCRGGWFLPSETAFGPGWTATVGDDLIKYLDAASTGDVREIADRLLVPPQSTHFSGHADTLRQWLETELGVMDGLRPVPVPEDWPAEFEMQLGYRVRLPTAPPPFVSVEHWLGYTAAREKELVPPFQSSFRYRLNEISSLPGLAAFDKLDNDVRRALMTVLLRSLEKWEPDWSEVRFRKIGGQAYTGTIPSLLDHVLRHLPWIVDDEAGSVAPGDRWLVPATAERAQRYQFRHLRPLCPGLTKMVLSNPKVSESLVALGMPMLDLEKRTRDSRLLDSLASALVEDRVDPVNRNIFLGQARDAWSAFYPTSGEALPERFVVLRGGQQLEVATPSEDQRVFIPDASRSTELDPYAALRVIFMLPSDGARLLPRLRERFGDTIESLSSLRLEVVVDGKPYHPPPESTRLISSPLSWIGPFVLTIAAFGSGHQPGMRSDRFKKGLAALRSVAVERVGGLCVRLLGIAAEEPRAQSAFYDAETHTILYDDQFETFLEDLAGPLQQVLDRADLMPSLRLALCKIGGDPEASRDRQLVALRSLSIPEVHFAEVCQLFTGDLAWVIERVRPALVLLAPECDVGTLTEADSVDALIAIVAPHLQALPAAELIELARNARDDAALGRALFGRVGGSAELAAWNAAIALLGPPYRYARNALLQQEFDDHRREALTPIRAFARRLALASGSPQLFLLLTESMIAREPPDELARHYWTLPFHEALRVLTTDFLTVDGAGPIVAAIDGVADAASLVNALMLADRLIECTRDPTEVHRDNVDLCRRRLEDLRAVALIVCDRKGVPAGPFLFAAEALFEAVRAELDGGTGFLEVLDETRVLSLLASKLPRDPSHNLLWEVMEASDSVDAFRVSFGITPDELQAGTALVEKARDQARKKERLIDVCGEPFDGERGNLAALRAHLERRISDDDLPIVDPRKVSSLEKLAPVGKNLRSRSGGIGKRQKSPPRPTDERLALVGLAGEILAYRVLKKHFGEAMTPGTWVSLNSQHCFPANPGDDGLGYDFCVTIRRKTFYIEVKATSGDDELFELGSTEIRCALDCARRQRTYRILHIQNALSGAPVARFLPNPFETGSKDRFRMDESGLRIRYRSTDQE